MVKCTRQSPPHLYPTFPPHTVLSRMEDFTARRRLFGACFSPAGRRSSLMALADEYYDIFDIFAAAFSGTRADSITQFSLCSPLELSRHARISRVKAAARAAMRADIDKRAGPTTRAATYATSGGARTVGAARNSSMIEFHFAPAAFRFSPLFKSHF